jgi:hypothetical protein
MLLLLFGTLNLYSECTCASLPTPTTHMRTATPAPADILGKIMDDHPRRRIVSRNA